jgi:pimeloyl-ACP methyl ester carboxylesterase
MMAAMTKALLFFFLLFSQLASADSFQASLEGWHHQHILRLRNPSPTASEILKNISTSVLEKDVEVALNVTSTDRPLVVVLPGLFAGLDAVEGMRLAQILLKGGFNVLRVPNPASRHIVQDDPKYAPLDFESEAQIYVDIVREIQKEYHFPVVHFAGVSYGAFIAPVAASKLAGDFNGKLLLLSPPQNIYTSLKQMDRFFDELKDHFDELPIAQLWFWARLKWARLWLEDISVTPEFAKVTLVVYGFHRVFIELWEMREQSLHPRPWWRFYENWSREARERRSAMRFESHLRKYNPHFFADPAKHDAIYWIQKSGAPWFLFASSDDFINLSNPWRPSENVRVFEDSGHIFTYMEKP